MLENLSITKTTFPLTKEVRGRRYLVDIAKDPALIDQAFSLRYKVFNLELGEGLKSSEATERDQDVYDPFCDQLVVIDCDRNAVVGTYRIMPYANAKANRGFYSATEFDLSKIYENLPDSAEIGRCCVHAEYRSGLVMNLLWYGLAIYMLKNQINYLFGCTSLNKGDTHEQASLIYKVCEADGALADFSLSVVPQPGFAVKGFDPDLRLPDLPGSPRRLLPSLLRGYLSVGGKIGGAPAFDPEFGVIDFFTLFDFKGINKAASRFLPR